MAQTSGRAPTQPGASMRPPLPTGSIMPGLPNLGVAMRPGGPMPGGSMIPRPLPGASMRPGGAPGASMRPSGPFPNGNPRPDTAGSPMRAPNAGNFPGMSMRPSASPTGSMIPGSPIRPAMPPGSSMVPGSPAMPTGSMRPATSPTGSMLPRSPQLPGASMQPGRPPVPGTAVRPGLQQMPGASMRPGAPPGASMRPGAPPGASMRPGAPPGASMRPGAPPGASMRPGAPPGASMRPGAPPGASMRPGAPPGASMRPGAPPGASMRPGAPPGASMRPGAPPGASMRPGAPPGASMRPGAPPGASMRPGAPPGASMRPGAPPGASMRPGLPPGASMRPGLPPGASMRPGSSPGASMRPLISPKGSMVPGFSPQGSSMSSRGPMPPGASMRPTGQMSPQGSLFQGTSPTRSMQGGPPLWDNLGRPIQRHSVESMRHTQGLPMSSTRMSDTEKVGTSFSKYPFKQQSGTFQQYPPTSSQINRAHYTSTDQVTESPRDILSTETLPSEYPGFSRKEIPVASVPTSKSKFTRASSRDIHTSVPRFDKETLSQLEQSKEKTGKNIQLDASTKKSEYDMLSNNEEFLKFSDTYALRTKNNGQYNTEPIIKVCPSTADLISLDSESEKIKETVSRAIQTGVFRNTIDTTNNILRSYPPEIPTENSHYDETFPKYNIADIPYPQGTSSVASYSGPHFNISSRLPIHSKPFALQSTPSTRSTFNGFGRNPRVHNKNSNYYTSPSDLLSWTSRTPSMYKHSAYDGLLFGTPKDYRAEGMVQPYYF